MTLLDHEISSRSPVYQGQIYQGARVRVRVALTLLILALDPEEYSRRLTADASAQYQH